MPSIYVVTEACIDVKDMSCKVVCPVDCIHTTDEDRVCYIDPDACTGCNECLPACPVGAIFTADPTPVSPAAPKAWTELNALWFHDPHIARSKIDGF